MECRRGVTTTAAAAAAAAAAGSVQRRTRTELGIGDCLGYDSQGIGDCPRYDRQGHWRLPVNSSMADYVCNECINKLLLKLRARFILWT